MRSATQKNAENEVRSVFNEAALILFSVTIERKDIFISQL